MRLDVATATPAAGAPRLPADIEQTVYRVVQEAVGNALRHAHPSLVTVYLSRTADGWLHGSVVDDGVGFAVDAATRGHGLSSMHERCILCSGHLQIDSEPGRGTRVTYRLPIAGP